MVVPMMVTTHVLVGVLLGALVSSVAPTAAAVPVVAGAVGGVFPDLDMVLDHRRTFHYPVYFPLVAGVLAMVAVWVPTPLVVALTVAVGAAGLHSVMDVFSGGQELRPWERVDDRAVFDHHSNRWLRARRVVYSGSPGDFVLGALAAGGVAVAGIDLATRLSFGVLVLSVPYTVFQRRIAASVPRRFQTLSDFLKHGLALGAHRLRDIVRK